MRAIGSACRLHRRCEAQATGRCVAVRHGGRGHARHCNAGTWGRFAGRTGETPAACPLPIPSLGGGKGRGRTLLRRGDATEGGAPSPAGWSQAGRGSGALGKASASASCPARCRSWTIRMRVELVGDRPGRGRDVEQPASSEFAATALAADGWHFTSICAGYIASVEETIIRWHSICSVFPGALPVHGYRRWRACHRSFVRLSYLHRSTIG